MDCIKQLKMITLVKVKQKLKSCNILHILQGEYMSLSLENGHIVYQYYLGDGSYGRIPTDFKYNRNKWVSVALIRNGYFGELLL